MVGVWTIDRSSSVFSTSTSLPYNKINKSPRTRYPKRRASWTFSMCTIGSSMSQWQLSARTEKYIHFQRNPKGTSNIKVEEKFKLKPDNYLCYEITKTTNGTSFYLPKVFFLIITFWKLHGLGTDCKRQD